MGFGLPKVFRVFRRRIFFKSQDVVERLIEGVVGDLPGFVSGSL